MAWLAAIRRAATGGLYLRTSINRCRPVSEIVRKWRPYVYEHPVVNSCAFMHTSSGWNQQPGHLDQGPTTPPTLESLAGGKKIRVTWSDGEESTYHAVWLRHNCRCPECWDPVTEQTLVTPENLRGKLSAQSALLHTDHTLEIQWSHDGAHGHSGFIPLQWLRDNSYSKAALDRKREQNRPPVATTIPQVSYQEVSQSDQGLWRWLRNLSEYGVCLVTGVPTNLGNGNVMKLAELAGGVQETLYGKTFCVKVLDTPTNLAYTTKGLLFHSDLIFYESPPGLQMLHCIRNDACVEGGDSVILDGFALVEKLKRNHPQHFETLTRVPTTFIRRHFGRENPAFYYFRRPHITLDQNGEVTAFFWNCTLAGPLLVPEELVEPYYEAFTCMGTMIEAADELKLFHRLEPGEALTFNNRRMWHSRTEYRQNGGVRYLEGLYVNIDDFQSKVRVLASKFSPEYAVKNCCNQDVF